MGDDLEQPDDDLDAAAAIMRAAATQVVDAALGLERRKRRPRRIAAALAVVAFLIVWRYDDVRDCNAANDQRRDTRRAFEVTLEPPEGTPPDQVEAFREFRERTLAAIDAELPPRSCSVLPW